MNITRNQWMAVAGVVLSAIVVSTSYFTDMFGPQVAKEIVGTAAFLNIILGGVVYALTGQGQQIADVQAIANNPMNMQSQSAKVALVTATDSLPEVMGVPTSNTPAGKALADSVQSNTVQVTGR